MRECNVLVDYVVVATPDWHFAHLNCEILAFLAIAISTRRDADALQNLQTSHGASWRPR